ncbi:MAG TPA: ribose-5-phosphate isomerase RpiA [Methanocorpusculum sp.]|nr:ribose-5-phosphate isomerase RpiA [Methanocorpusculum sp.]HJJ57747.1 ribose-5-phosphate isomerase RpiA [Methanocorpusculum sp.]HJJ95449.1 ribose-5-phosphate isomerase RpiA [Methanocorpusculum sp.]
MSDASAAKRDAGFRAADMVKDGMIVGLGTGSTVFFAMERLGERIKNEGLKIKGVPTSNQTAMRAEEYGIPLTTLSLNPVLDIAIDGADQVSPEKNLIKGRGAALLREKIVADAAKKFVVVIDESKSVAGLNAAVPIEILPFAYGSVCEKLKELGGNPEMRNGVKKDGPVISDNGNYIFDCAFGEINDPKAMEKAINEIPGVLENGIFASMNAKTEIIIGKP